MALLLTRNYKGQDASYWRISSVTADCVKNHTTVSLCLYFTRDTRLANVDNHLTREVIILDGIDLTRAQMYLMLKEPIMRTQDDGSEVNVNPFANAQDA
jgi:hypothetical protein